VPPNYSAAVAEVAVGPADTSAEIVACVTVACEVLTFQTEVELMFDQAGV
jgi:hypothetical protein